MREPVKNQNPLAHSGTSDISPLVGVTAQIPARRGTGVGKQRVDAGFGLGWIENELRFSILLQHRVVVIHHNRSVGIPVRRDADPKHDKVRPVCDQRYRSNSGYRADKKPAKGFS